jgi:hypothetical protein
VVRHPSGQWPRPPPPGSGRSLPRKAEARRPARGQASRRKRPASQGRTMATSAANARTDSHELLDVSRKPRADSVPHGAPTLCRLCTSRSADSVVLPLLGYAVSPIQTVLFLSESIGKPASVYPSRSLVWPSVQRRAARRGRRDGSADADGRSPPGCATSSVRRAWTATRWRALAVAVLAAWGRGDAHNLSVRSVAGPGFSPPRARVSRADCGSSGHVPNFPIGIRRR